MSAIYFLSDAHLGSPYHDDPRRAEQRLVSWLRSIADDAEAVYLLGDMLDYWFDYEYVVPRGAVRFLAILADLVERGVEVHYIVGNHDLWLTDYFTKELGVIVHRDSIICTLRGRTFRLSHGHHEYALRYKKERCLFGVFESKLARKLYAAIHPRWTVAFAQRMAYRNRMRQLKQASDPSQPGRNPQMNIEEDEWLVQYTKLQIPQHPEIDYYIYGHRHLLLHLSLPEDRRCIILGDWIHYYSYARWDGNELTLSLYDEAHTD
jgi:Uncharacterized protein conserved in bacteria